MIHPKVHSNAEAETPTRPACGSGVA